MITSEEDFGSVLANMTRLLGDEFNQEQFQRFLNKNAKLIANGNWKMRDIEPNRVYVQLFGPSVGAWVSSSQYSPANTIRIIGCINNEYSEAIDFLEDVADSGYSLTAAESKGLTVTYYKAQIPSIRWPKTLLWTKSGISRESDFRDILVQTTRGTFRFEKVINDIVWQSGTDYGDPEAEQFNWNGWVGDITDFQVWELPINFGTNSIISLNYPAVGIK